jgi:protein PhnA
LAADCEQVLRVRSSNVCELCGADHELSACAVAPSDGSPERSILTCGTCRAQIEHPETMDANHWRCLNESMWSQVPAVQVMAWRMLNRLRAEGWPQDLLDMLYLDDEVRAWAEAGEPTGAVVKHVDCHGATLAAGDTVTLVKDLDVKGSSITAKRGTAVRNIRLVHDNPEQIEGRVDGQQIVILTKFVKKSA